MSRLPLMSDQDAHSIQNQSLKCFLKPSILVHWHESVAAPIVCRDRFSAHYLKHEHTVQLRFLTFVQKLVISSQPLRADKGRVALMTGSLSFDCFSMSTNLTTGSL